VRAIARTTSPDNRESVVVDDGGNGDLESLLAGLPVRLVHTGGAGSAGIARNRGALEYGGDVLVFVDADVEVQDGAIGRLVAPIASGAADATVGNYSTDISGMGFAQAYKQLYLSRVYSRRAGYIRNHFWTALGAIRASTFKALGGFAPRFKGACDEDTELGQRLTLCGGRILAVPQARARNLKPYSLAGLVRNDLRKGMSTIRLFLGDNVALTDNRHASRRDILAVILAGVFVLFLVCSPWMPSPANAALPFLAAALYVCLRADLIRAFCTAGWFFGLRAAPVMFALDLVRGFCAGTALIGLALRGGRTLFRPGFERERRLE
jgi:cellulose synthase/poly-beta-1,6-N-acetylglucosamine synthase-like glycosyltransferase